MKPSDHVPTPEIDEIAGLEKKNVIKPTKFCPSNTQSFGIFLRGSSMKICPINVPSLFQISRWLGNLRWLPCHGSKHFRKYPRWCWTKCAKQNMYISTNAKYMDTGHRYNQTSKQREEHQEYQLDPRYLSSLSNLKRSVKCHAPHSHSSPGISRLWWVLVNHLPIHSKGRITLAEFENCVPGNSSTMQHISNPDFEGFLYVLIMEI